MVTERLYCGPEGDYSAIKVAWNLHNHISTFPLYNNNNNNNTQVVTHHMSTQEDDESQMQSGNMINSGTIDCTDMFLASS